MSSSGKVIWSEGMFLKPQHFQQYNRYVEGLVEDRSVPGRSYAWGFSELSIDDALLKMGKLAIQTARGVFPDGTPFVISENSGQSVALEVPENCHQSVVCLVVPGKNAATAEADGYGESSDGMIRYHAHEVEVRDNNAGRSGVAQVQVGQLRLALMLEEECGEEYAKLGVVRVAEAKSDKSVSLDTDYIPPTLDCRSSAYFSALLKELHGLLHHRADALAGRVSASGRAGAAEIADFLLLQAVNRYEPLVHHIAEVDGLHPEELYRLGVMMAGELSTFASREKRPVEFAAYQHDDLAATFGPLHQALQNYLSMVLEQNAVAIPLAERKYGIHVAPITDRKLLEDGNFVLAVTADMPTEDLRKRLPLQVKIGPVEQIRELVNLQLPGVLLRPLPVAPRQIPYHSTAVYFELDRSSEHWQQLKKSGGFAIHLGGDFPGITMDFWCIRGSQS